MYVAGEIYVEFKYFEFKTVYFFEEKTMIPHQVVASEAASEESIDALFGELHPMSRVLPIQLSKEQEAAVLQAQSEEEFVSLMKGWGYDI